MHAFTALLTNLLGRRYEMMQLCRQFENACNQAYMQGHIRGFMHLDNGQETIPALIADSIKNGRPLRASIQLAVARRFRTPISARRPLLPTPWRPSQRASSVRTSTCVLDWKVCA